MTTLVNQKGPSKKKKGRSKKAHVLSAAVQKATEHFIAQGEMIANENPEIRNEMMAAVDDVRKTGGEYEETWFNTLRPRQNDQHFFRQHFHINLMNEDLGIISPNFVPNSENDNKTALVQIMAWCRTGNKPSMMAYFTDAYICHSATMI